VSEEPANVIEAPLINPPRGAAVAFIFVTILLDMFALGLIMPVLPKLVESFVDNDTATAARIFGLFGTAWALMQFFFSPILGGLSDRFGRRPVVLLSNLGLALDYVLMALAPSLIWLFVGRVISGITSASVSTAFAYLADVTPPERRAAVFGKVGVAFGAGFILGPALRRPARWHGSAAAVLGGCGFELCQHAVWRADPAGIAAEEPALTVSLAQRQSDRRAETAAIQPGACGSFGSDFHRPGGACGVALYVRALRNLSLWLG
jgi:MFS family permease